MSEKLIVMQRSIKFVCDEIYTLLCDKNAAYGNSAAEPCNIFAKCDAEEQLNVRIDDKLNRMIQGKEYPGDDTELDLIGYLLLKRAVRRYKNAYPTTSEKSCGNPRGTEQLPTSDSDQCAETRQLLEGRVQISSRALSERRIPRFEEKNCRPCGNERCHDEDCGC